MNHLVVQHPQLSEAMLAQVVQAVGRGADRREPTLAVWHEVALRNEAAQALSEAAGVDAALVPAGRRLDAYRLLVFDMDSTLITIECIDEIADFVGKKREVAAITEAAMRGEIKDYGTSLRQRVALLTGLDQSVLQKVYDERLQLSPGAQTLISTAQARGLRVLLVSGGFTFFTQRLQQRLKLDFTRSNELALADGRLTGHLVGEIVDARVKRNTVEATCRSIGCATSQAIVVGDGANDLEMMAIAGISVAYRAKPVVRAQTTHSLNHNGLDAILNFFDAG